MQKRTCFEQIRASLGPAGHRHETQLVQKGKGAIGHGPHRRGAVWLSRQIQSQGHHVAVSKSFDGGNHLAKAYS